MADFANPIHRLTASVLEGLVLVFVHCVSSEPMLLVSMGYRVFCLNAVRLTSKESLFIQTKFIQIHGSVLAINMNSIKALFSSKVHLCFFPADFFERVSRIFLLGNYKKVCHLLKWKLSHR